MNVENVAGKSQFCHKRDDKSFLPGQLKRVWRFHRELWMSEAPASIFNQMHKAGRRDNGKSCPVKIFNKDFKAHSRHQGMIFILTIFIFGQLLPLLEWLDLIPATFLFVFYMRGRIICIGSKVRMVAGPQTKKLASIHLQFAICNAKSNIRHNLGPSPRDSPIHGSSLDLSEKIFSS